MARSNQQATLQQQGGKGNLKRNPSKMGNPTKKTTKGQLPKY